MNKLRLLLTLSLEFAAVSGYRACFIPKTIWRFKTNVNAACLIDSSTGMELPSIVRGAYFLRANGYHTYRTGLTLIGDDFVCQLLIKLNNPM